MKVLIIFANQNEDSLCRSISDVAVKELSVNGHQAMCHNLFEEGFASLIYKPKFISEAIEARISRQCLEVSEADGFIIIHPDSRGQPPGIIEEWIERVMCEGVSYKTEDAEKGIMRGLLKAKSAVVFVTENSPVMRDMAVYSKPLKIMWKHCVFGLGGVDNFEMKMFGGAGTCTPQERAGWLIDVRFMINKFFHDAGGQPLAQGTAKDTHARWSDIDPILESTSIEKAKDDWETVVDIVKVMVKTKAIIVDFFKISYKTWKKDKAFWTSLIYEGEQHIVSLKRVLKMVPQRPQKFKIGDPVSFEGARMFISQVELNIKRVRKGEIPIKEALIVARDIAVPSIIKRYNEIVFTDDQEYNTVIGNVVSESIIHKTKLSKRISYMASGLKEKDVRQPADAPVRRLEPDDSSVSAQVVRYHEQANEYISSLREMMDTFGTQNTWKYLSKLEVFLKRDVYEHFRYEDDVVFSAILAKSSDKGLQDIISKLTYEHQILFDKIGDFEQMIFGEIFPLPKERVEAIRDFLSEFVENFSRHLEDEEKHIVPLLKQKTPKTQKK